MALWGWSVVALLAHATETSEVVLDFEQAVVAKPVASWTEKGVVFALAGAPVHSKAAGRVTFFPYLTTARKGILNAMAQEQAIPLQASFPRPVSRVTLVLWGSPGCPAQVQAFDRSGRLIDTAALAAVPARVRPEDPMPQFELTVRGDAIASIQVSGARNGEFIAIDEMRFVPEVAAAPGWDGRAR